jgi:hypothetical protein
MENEIHCPKCGGTQFHTDKKGFSGKKAVAGALLTGGIGVLAGTIGSNKVKITCLSCGYEFAPGQGNKTDSFLPPNPRPLSRPAIGLANVPSKSNFKAARILSIIVASISGLITLLMSITYFSMENGEAKSSLVFILLLFCAITLLFVFFARKSKHPAEK